VGSERNHTVQDEVKGGEGEGGVPRANKTKKTVPRQTKSPQIVRQGWGGTSLGEE